MGNMTMAINELNLEELTKNIKITMRRSAKDAVQLGYMLRRVIEQRIYLQEYTDFDSYLANEINMDYTMANRFIGINKKYFYLGNSMEISEKYEQYSQGLLIEMLSMTPEQEAKVTPDMTVKQAREIKKADKKPKPAGPVKKPDIIIDADFREVEEPVATSQLEKISTRDDILEQLELPVLKNSDQRKEWLAKYKDWGIWYRDENIDVNYYKFDFQDGSRLIVAEYPQRESYWSRDKKDQYYYHLLKNGSKDYDKQYHQSTNSETQLVEFLKELQKK